MTIKACAKHAANPVKGYSACPGCEVEDLRRKTAALEKQNAELLAALKEFADRQYCLYIEKLRREECLGVEFKMTNGRFGEPELKAHCSAAEHLGAHRAIHQFLQQHKPSTQEVSNER